MNENIGDTPLIKSVLDATVMADPPVFEHPDIGQLYKIGCYSRLEAELEDVLRGPKLHPIAVGDVASLLNLHGIAYLRDGEVLPLIDLEKFLEQLPRRLHELRLQDRRNVAYMLSRLLLIQAGIILDGLASERQQESDDDPGEMCGIPT